MNPEQRRAERKKLRADLEMMVASLRQERTKLERLHSAIARGNIDEVVALSAELANEQPDFLETPDPKGNTALMIAAYNANSKLVHWLLDVGANVNTRAINGDTPLHVVAFTGKLDVMSELLDHGADIESETTDGRRPIHLAIASGYKRAFNLLLSWGARFDPTEEHSVQAAKIGKYIKRVR